MIALFVLFPALLVMGVAFEWFWTIRCGKSDKSD